MTSLLARAASLVVEPRTPADRSPHMAPASTRALVLGTPASAPPVAAALAGSLRAHHRAPAALLCVWSPSPTAPLAQPGLAPSASFAPPPESATHESAPLAAWASAGARRLAARLYARDLVVRAIGRLAWLILPDDPEAAAPALGGLLGWLDAPVVTALAAPRPEGLNTLVAAHDLVVAVRPPAGGMSSTGRETLGALALEGLPDPAIRAVACDPLPGGVASWRARAGLARLPAGHPALAGLLAAPGSVVA
jgi:hypothetical protein